MKKILRFSLILMLIFSTYSLSFAQVSKDETVYVNLDSKGKAKDIKIVNRIYGEAEEDYYIDYGEYNYVKPLVYGFQPIIEKDRVKWPLKNLKNGSIYYEGTIDKALPMDIDIKYYLDGNPIAGEELAGKSGDFRMDISINDQANLSTQIQIPLNVDKFSDIRAENGTISVVGKTINVVFTHMAIMDDDFSLRAKGNNIELDSIMITSTNSELPFLDELEEFSSGIDELNAAFDELKDGSGKLNKGTNELKDGLKALDGGVGELHTGFNKINQQTGALSAGFNEFNTGLKELKDGMGNLVHGIEDLNKRFEQIFGGRDNLEEILSELEDHFTDWEDGNEELMELLKELRDRIDENEDIQNEIEEGIGKINIDKEEIEKIIAELEDLYKDINDIDFDKLYGQLQTLPDNMNTMYSGHSQLTKGLDSLFGGLDSLGQGMSQLKNNTRVLPGNVGQLAEGQRALTEGIARLQKEGIGEIENFLDEFMLNSEEEYKSFVDDRNVNNSTCQFVMKTDAIKIEKNDDDQGIEDNPRRNFFQRIIDMFRRK